MFRLCCSPILVFDFNFSFSTSISASSGSASGFIYSRRQRYRLSEAVSPEFPVYICFLAGNVTRALTEYLHYLTLLLFS